MASDIVHVILLSLFVSGLATLLGALIGIPLGSWLGLRTFWGKEVIKTLTFTLYGFPPVVAGLLIYVMLSSSGPLGSFNILLTPTAMILAQLVLVLPIITGLTMAAVSDIPRDVLDTARTLGANEWQTTKAVLHDARVAIASAIMVGFGRAIGEVGAVYLVGGNIKWHTRVLTTSIVMETRQGNFEYGLALGAVLMIIALVVFYILKRFQDRGAVS